MGEELEMSKNPPCEAAESLWAAIGNYFSIYAYAIFYGL